MKELEMPELSKTIWTWDSSICKSDVLKLCILNLNDKLILQITNGGELTLKDSKGKRSIAISKDMIDHYYIVHKYNKKGKVGEMLYFDIYFKEEYLSEVANALSMKRISKDFLLKKPSSKESSIAEYLSAIFDANGVLTQGAKYSFERVEASKNLFNMIDVKCESCGREWEMVDLKVATLKKCPFCNADLDGKGIAFLFNDNSQFPEDCHIVNGKLISRRRYSEEFYNIPDSVTEIGDGVFNRCPETYIHIGGNVKKIGNYAFANMPNLWAVDFEEGCEEIADNIFQNCPNLEHVNFPSTLKRVTSGVKAYYPGVVDGIFANCPSMKNVVLPSCFSARDCEQEANLLPSTATIYVRNSKSEFESSSVTYSEPGGYSERYDLYLGGTKIGTARGGYHGPTYNTETTSYNMPENVVYNYNGTPDAIPFFWKGSKGSVGVSRKDGSCLSITNGGMLGVTVYKNRYQKKSALYDAGAVAELKITKPKGFSDGCLTFRVSSVRIQAKARQEYLYGGRTLKFEYDKNGFDNVLKMVDVLRENGVFVEFEN